jgi:hypothetical protein
MAASLLGLGLLLVGTARAQDATRATNPPSPYPAIPTPEPDRVYHYMKPAGINPVPVTTFRADKPAGSSYAPAAPTVVMPRGLSGLSGPTDASSNFTAYQSPKPAKGGVSPEAAGASPAPERSQAIEGQEYYIQLEPPGPQELFGRLDSEAALQERIRQKARERTPVERIEFPVEPTVGKGPFVPRSYAQSKMLVEPNYVCYGRLFFEDKNSERYGWELGPLQPIVSAGLFYKDLAFLPYHAFTNPLRCYECSAGYCLPGDPVPYLIYPPGLSLTGAVMEGGIGVALFAIFP